MKLLPLACLGFAVQSDSVHNLQFAIIGCEALPRPIAAGGRGPCTPRESKPKQKIRKSQYLP